jgi:hypothetical protein
VPVGVAGDTGAAAGTQSTRRTGTTIGAVFSVDRGQ